MPYLYPPSNFVMIILLSPAKNLRFDVDVNGMKISAPEFHDKALPLVKKLSKFTKPKLMKLMSISEKLALLNLDRYKTFTSDPFSGEHLPAIHAFNGEVYWGLDSLSMSKSDMKFANKHVRILSGMYGTLKPSDAIQPYRLEMGSKLPIGRKKNLYEYWKQDVAVALNRDLDASVNNVIINLASKEYFQVVAQELINAKLINVHFREYRNDILKAIQFNLKRARGMMTRYIINNKLTSIEGIKGFDTDGYYFDSDLSDEENWYFIK